MKLIKRIASYLIIITILINQITTIDVNGIKYINKVKQNKKVVIHKTIKVTKAKIHKVKKLNFIVTFYTNSVACCNKTNGISASGLNLLKATRNSRGANNRNEIHYIAIPKGIKFGTKFYIEGYGVCIAVDCGGAIKYKYINGKKYIKVDMFVPRASHKELMKLGKVYREGYLIK